MSEIKDTPPPLPYPQIPGNYYSAEQYRAGEAAAFSRGVAAGQAAEQEEWLVTQRRLESQASHAEAAADELRAKLKALEEQKPAGCIHEDTLEMLPTLLAQDGGAKIWPAQKLVFNTSYVPLYLAAGAKHE